MPDKTVSLRLAEILAARLCHDLSSPLGALAATLDLAVEGAGSPDGREALIAACASARQLSRKLRLLRAAWAADPGPLEVASLEELAAGLPNWLRLTLDLVALDRAPVFAPSAGRVVLNMLLLGAGALPMGGALALTGNAASEVRLTIAGRRAAWPAELAGYLLDPASAWDAIPNDLQPGMLVALLTALLADDAGLELRLHPADGATANEPAALVLHTQSR